MVSPTNHAGSAQVNVAAKAADADGTTGAYTYILDSVKVLTVGSSVAAQQATSADTSGDATAAAPTNSGVLTFEVTQEQALRIVNANQGGSQIYLVLLAPDSGADCRSGQGRGEQQVAPWSRTPRRRAPSRRRRVSMSPS